MEKEENILGTEKIGKLMIKFAVPSIISLLVNSIYLLSAFRLKNSIVFIVSPINLGSILLNFSIPSSIFTLVK